MQDGEHQSDVKTYPGKDCNSDIQFIELPTSKKIIRNRWHLKTDAAYKNKAEVEIKKRLRKC